MAFISGSILIDAPASALNNSGEPIQGARTENTSSVKYITGQDRKTYPYISGQALRYWLRNTLETAEDITWESSQLYRGDKIAYSDANPIKYWDDDLLGYMRAPSSKEYKNTLKAEAELNMTPLEQDEKGNPKPLTRASPFRVGTLVSVGPVNLTQDFGVMARQDGDPVPFEHQFYRAKLHTLFAIDLNMVGTFTYRRRSGFQNLDSIRKTLAEEKGLEHLEEEKAYRLPPDERSQRVQSLLRGLGRLNGGAKQSIHYTDVSPAVAVAAVVKGGNHPFNYLFKLKDGEVVFDGEVFEKAVKNLLQHDQLLSPVYIGWKPGFLPESQALVPSVIEGAEGRKAIIRLDMPQTVFEELGKYVVENANKVMLK